MYKLNVISGRQTKQIYTLLTRCVASSSYASVQPADNDDFVKNLFNQLIKGQRSALARGITLVESRHPRKRVQAQSLLNMALSVNARRHRHPTDSAWSGGCFRVGITGPPGAGKSTLLEALCVQLTEQGLQVAILAIDPTSARSGGSLLGDKTRMPRLSRNKRAYIRPSPSAGAPGGVARGTSEAAVLCEAAGYDLLFVETVGVGQSEVAVADLVDCCCLLLPPAGGDELQGIKKGVVEMADVVAVTKSDGALMADARRVAADYTSALKFVRPRNSVWRPPVLMVSSQKGAGLEKLWKAVMDFREAMTESGELYQRRRQQRHAWLWRQVRQRLVEEFSESSAVRQVLPRVETQVLEGSVTPGAAADYLLSLFKNNNL